MPAQEPAQDEQRIEEVAEAPAEAASENVLEETVLDKGSPAPVGQDDSPETAEADAEPDWEDLAKRKAAELENFRKQAAQRVQKATKDGMRRVTLEILPALDDFERALAHAEAEEGDDTQSPSATGTGEHHLTSGIRLVQEQMLAALRRAGIESFSPKGEPFDPRVHEAVATTPVEGAESGTVVEVYQAGYRLGDDVLRAAKVVVAA
jgi:Molecular chaperone GrpE (heat shock protein)